MVDEYLACGMLPRSASFGFAEIADGETLVSMVTLPLPEFPLAQFWLHRDCRWGDPGIDGDFTLARVSPRQALRRKQ
jgi:hypothetical protein